MAIQLNSMQKRILVQKGRKPCFRCDGTGEICNVCGESRAACKCNFKIGEEDYGPCEDCAGEGSVESAPEAQ
jgi:hypothetical protein